MGNYAKRKAIDTMAIKRRRRAAHSGRPVHYGNEGMTSTACGVAFIPHRRTNYTRAWLIVTCRDCLKVKP